jgi:hypothetical protein
VGAGLGRPLGLDQALQEQFFSAIVRTGRHGLTSLARNAADKLNDADRALVSTNRSTPGSRERDR